MSTDPPLSDREMSAPLVEQFQSILGGTEPPRTYGEWAAATAAVLAEAGIPLDADALCTTEESRHRATVGDDTRQFRCVLDTLLVPFVLDADGQVAVHSRCPTTDDPVELTVTRDGVTAEPSEAVVSFGIFADAEPPEDLETNPLAASERFCPYVNAFADAAAYRAWEAETPEAVTTALTPDEAFALAELLVEELPEA